MCRLLGKRTVSLGTFLLAGILLTAESFGIAQSRPVACCPVVAAETHWPGLLC